MKISQQVFAIFLLTALLLTLTACGASATINKDQKTASWVNVIDGPPADEELFDGEIYSNDVISLGNYQKDGTHAEFWCETGASGDAWVELPILNYKGYHAKDRYGNELETEDGTNNVLRIRLPQEYTGLVTVDYAVPGYYRLADLGSLLCILGLCIFLCRRRKSALLERSEQ